MRGKPAKPTEPHNKSYRYQLWLKPPAFSCDVCSKTFTRRDNLRRHKKRHGEGFRVQSSSFKCRQCEKSFNHRDYLKHLKMHSRPTIPPLSSQLPTSAAAPSSHRTSPIKCPICSKTFTRRDNLRRHIKNKHHPSSYPSNQRTRRQPTHSDSPPLDNPPIGQNDRPAQNDHPADDPDHPPRVENLPLHEDPVVFPDVEDGVDVGDGLYHIIREHWPSIRTHHLIGSPVQDIYNFRLVGSRNIGPGVFVTSEKALHIVFSQLQCRAKINISFGLILCHTVTK